MRRVFCPLLFRYNEERYFPTHLDEKNRKKVSVILKNKLTFLAAKNSFNNYFTGKGASQK